MVGRRYDNKVWGEGTIGKGTVERRYDNKV